jgi:uncharacterized RDD family membrane protein YckC
MLVSDTETLRIDVAGVYRIFIAVVAGVTAIHSTHPHRRPQVSDQTFASTANGTPIERASSTTALASTGQRLGNFLLDQLFYQLIAIVIGLVVGAAGLARLLEGAGAYLFSFTLLFAYYAVPEAMSGRTLGKLITGTKAVTQEGLPLSPGQAIGRTLCRFIPFEPFSFLGGAGKPTGWHDRIPKTKVISLR